MCTPCGQSVCYKYEDCGPALQCLPRSAFKRNGLQDCQFFQQGSIRYLCRAGPCCTRPCPPRCPPCVRRPPPGKTYKGKPHESQGGHTSHAEEGSAHKNDEKENQLKRTKSRELRGGIMYYSCHCIKRNGLQHDCRRTGCGGEPACLVLPDPVCPPSQLARARGLAAPLVVDDAPGSGGASGGHAHSHSHGGGKRFIVCELKEAHHEAEKQSSDGKCCKCPISQDHTLHNNPNASSGVCCLANVPISPIAPMNKADARCPCKSVNTAQPHSSGQYTAFKFDDETLNTVLKHFEGEGSEVVSHSDKAVIGPGGRARKPKPPVVKETCTRPGCMHWKPPSPCVWDLPCKADCFETPAGIQPGRNKLKSGSGGWISKEGH